MSTIPPWLAPFVTPKTVSVGRCDRCLSVYRSVYGRGPISACEGCPGTIVQWKRCSACRRWKAAHEYPRQKKRWLHSECKRCFSIRAAALWKRRYDTNPAWAAKVRADRRLRRARGKEVATT